MQVPVSLTASARDAMHTKIPALLRSTALTAYGAAWLTARPFLRRSSRLRDGWRERLVPPHWGIPRPSGEVPQQDMRHRGLHGWQDVWIQAASGGEAYLVREILRAWNRTAGDAPPTNVLATTWTRQGMDVLEKARDDARPCDASRIQPAWFPLDEPRLMRRALYNTLPKAVVLLETEIWPGLLAACAGEGVPVAFINARMTARSLAGYLTMRSFLRSVGPREVLAVSERDAARFTSLFPDARVEVMSNIKFDRLEDSAAPTGLEEVSRILRSGPVIVLGSVREEEEAEVETIIAGLQAARPDATIALCPRHMHRCDRWAVFFEKRGMNWKRRSALSGPPEPGGIILWDTFGELGAAYALGHAAFVGGSIKPLGGQNFLEPLGHGLSPVIGPSWSNFHWVGKKLFDEDLVHKAKDPEEITAALLRRIERPADRDSIRDRFNTWLNPRRGGSVAACACIRRLLGTEQP